MFLFHHQRLCWFGLGIQGLTFKLFPTICFNTKYSSPFEMNPSLSMSYTLNATACERQPESVTEAQGEALMRARSPTLTPKLLLPSAFTAERAQAPHELLKVHRP